MPKNNLKNNITVQFIKKLMKMSLFKFSDVILFGGNTAKIARNIRK